MSGGDSPGLLPPPVLWELCRLWQKNFCYFTEFSNHINLEADPQPKEAEALEIYLRSATPRGLSPKGPSFAGRSSGEQALRVGRREAPRPARGLLARLWSRDCSAVHMVGRKWPYEIKMQFCPRRQFVVSVYLYGRFES